MDVEGGAGADELANQYELLILNGLLVPANLDQTMREAHRGFTSEVWTPYAGRHDAFGPAARTRSRGAPQPGPLPSFQSPRRTVRSVMLQPAPTATSGSPSSMATRSAASARAARTFSSLPMLP